MKKHLIIFSFALFFSSNIYGQGFPKIYASAGISMVDDSYVKTYNPFGFDKQWNIGGFPSSFKLGVDFRKQWILEGSYSINTLKTGKLVNGKILKVARDYKSYEMQVKYYFGGEKYRLKVLDYVNPFLAFGYGTTDIDNIPRNNAVYGFGTYIWLYNRKDCDCSYLKKRSKDLNIGLLLQTVGKSPLSSSMQSIYGNQIEHNASIVVKF